MRNIYKRIIMVLVALITVSVGAQLAHADTYTSDLTLGSSGTQVVALQTWLESNGYLTMPQGVSKGYFGGITRTALASYQKSIGLPAYGFFGSMTRERLNRGDNSAGALNVISPNGGENWQMGTQQSIVWQDPFVVSGCPVGAYCSMAMPRYYNVKLLKYLYCDSLTPCGVPAPYVIAENVSEKTLTWNVGDYKNTSGSSVVPHGQYKIQVCTVAGNECDISDSYFTIKSSTVQSPITVLSPNGGEKLSIGSNHQIRWANTNTSYGSKVDLYVTPVVACPMIYPAPASCYPAPIVLDKNIDTNMIYNWIVGTDIVNNPIPAGEYQVKICSAGTSNCDTSDGSFSLVSTSTTASQLISTVSTDSTTYSKDQTINIHLTVRNPTNNPITMNFTSGCITKYTIDNVFDSMTGVMCTANVPQIIIPANSSRTWDMSHASSRYAIPVGTHTINAGFVGSSPLQASTQIRINSNN